MKTERDKVREIIQSVVSGNETESFFAFIKYEGNLVEDGFLDARLSGEALLNIDQALRYFLHQEEPELRQVEFTLPIRVHKGSWEAFFPENINELILTALFTAGATKYFGTALTEMAKNDFKDKGFKDLFKAAFKAMTWVIKIASHKKSIKDKDLGKIHFINDNKKIRIFNNEGIHLDVPIEFLEAFTNCPENLFSKLASIVENERELKIGYRSSNEANQGQIKTETKEIFTTNESGEEILFPELKHGDYVELEGHITRANEKSNTAGFLYKGHILTAIPNDGNVNKYKNAIFTNCLLKGFIDRSTKQGSADEPRPKLKFSSIEERNEKQQLNFKAG